jgi:homocysteine S-methyltransferase
MTSSQSLVERIARRELVLLEGAVIERLRRAPGVTLDPEVANAGLVYDARGRDAHRSIWRGYLEVAREHGLPMVLCAPTWRATPERLARAGLPPVARVCADAVALARETGSEPGATAAAQVHVAGLIGCRGDAYRPQEALTATAAEAFHREQAEALAAAGVDLVLAATLPAAGEALGIARAVAATGVPYLVGFVMRANGTLLDGEPLADAVKRLDDALPAPPLGYAGTCVHPDNLGAALEAAGIAAARFVAVQGNGSRLSPEELDGRATLEADAPEAFGKATARVARRFRLSLVGGCCGTDDRHLRAIAAELTRGVGAAGDGARRGER